MKKSKILKAILSPIFKGLAIFAIFGFAVYVYGAVSFPAEQPNPVTGVVGMFVGLSGSASIGSAGGYNSANTFCSSSFPGSHICTAMEIINTYNNNLSSFGTLSEQAWINNGPPGHDATLSNDCKGWQYGQAQESGKNRFASVWNFSIKMAKIQYCNAALKFACCK